MTTETNAAASTDDLTSGAKVTKGKATKGAAPKSTKATGKPNKAAANEKATLKAALKTGTEAKNLPANSKAPSKSASKAPAKSAAKAPAKGKAPAKAAAKSAPKAAKPKQKKASAEANRQSYAGRKITVLVKFADANLREGSGRAARYALIAKSKNTDDVLGKEVTDGAGNVSAVGGNHLAFFVANDFISLS